MSAHDCKRAIRKVCHCLVPDVFIFRQCCGWYCRECGGHGDREWLRGRLRARARTSFDVKGRP
jgi:hypothetical protein